MKRIILLFIITALAPSIAACGSGTPPASAVVDTNEPAIPGPGDASHEIVDRPVYDQGEIRAQFEQAVESCAEVIDGFEIDISQGAYPMPTLDEYAQMSDAIGALGFPVDYYDLDMPNYEKVIAFCDAVQGGSDAQIVIYSLHNTGIYGYILICRDGELYGASAVYNFPDYFSEDEVSEVEFYAPIYPVADLRLTENGYLVYRMPEYEGRSEMEREFRVMPLGEELRGLCRKYVWGFGYASGSLLAENWDETDVSSLDLQNVFDSLYSINGERPSQYSVEWPDDGEAIAEVPAAVMESVMLGSLPITLEQLREAVPYDETEDAYRYHIIFKGSYVTPEVVGVAVNADGSMTLTVYAPFDLHSGDVMTHRLTVADSPDGGVKYLSNVVVTPRK